MGIALEPCSITVARHGITIQPNGLSEFQNLLLESPSPVRLAEAPTGSGKSFAFIRAVNGGKRVLFIVPTRRLGQNLVKSLGEDLLQAGWQQQRIDKKIALWTSDGRQLMIDQGVRNVTQRRLIEMTQLSLSQGGEFVVATPESMAWLVMDPSRFPVSGVSDRTVINLLTDFDHIVFDEMHIIDAKGLSQGLILSRLASQNPEWSCCISFLSATPVDFRDAMQRFGVSPDGIEIIQGKVLSSPSDTTDMRMIHGDVRIHFHKNATIPDLLQNHLNKVLDEMAQGYSVILIYDELYSRFSRDLDRIDAILAKAGIAKEDRLLISSADDSAAETAGHPGFCSGRNKDPAQFKILVCTSSVEMGVTYKTRLTFMEPGHGSASFQQRVGRVARADTPGEIFVALGKPSLARHAWLRDVYKFAGRNHGKAVSVDHMNELLTRDTARRLSGSDDSFSSFFEEPKWFDRVPGRAAAIGGLAWCLMMEQHGVTRQRRKMLLDATPAIAKEMYHLLREIKKLEQSPLFATCVKEWLEAFRRSVLNYREIGKQIKVINPEGRECILSLRGIANNTDILDRFDYTVDDRGLWTVHIDNNYWRSYGIETKNRYKEICFLKWPHTDQVTQVPAGHSLRSAALNQLRKDLNSSDNEGVVSALKALEQIVEMTGLVVCSDTST